MTKLRRVEAEVFSPQQAPNTAQILSKTTNILRFPSVGKPADIELDRYVCLMRNAHFRPENRGILSEDGKKLIVPMMLPITPLITSKIFGDDVERVGKKSVRIQYPVPSMRINGDALCLYSSRNWAVFLLDAVIGAYRAENILGEPPRILLPEGLPPRFMEFLALAGIEARHVIKIPKGHVVSIANALLVSRSFAIDVRVKIQGEMRDLGVLVEPTDLGRFNKMIGSRFAAGPKRRIYVSRSDVFFRQVENEQEVSDVLSSRGFETYFPASMPVQDVVKTFANAEIVVGPMGSGMVNVIFAPPHTSVIEFDHPHNDFVTHGICRVLNLKTSLVGRIPTDQRKRRAEQSIRVDLDELCQKVDQALDLVTY